LLRTFSICTLLICIKITPKPSVGTLKDTRSLFFTPKRYEEHPRLRQKGDPGRMIVISQLLFQNDNTIDTKFTWQWIICILFKIILSSNMNEQIKIALLHDDVIIKIFIKILLFNAKDHGNLAGTKQANSLKIVSKTV